MRQTPEDAAIKKERRRWEQALVGVELIPKLLPRNAFRNAWETIILYTGLVTQGAREQVTTRLTTRNAVRLAWSLWVACLALIALALLLDFLHIDDILSYPWQTRRNDMALYPVYAVLTGMVSLVYPTIGALIVSRLPKNPIG